MKKLTYYEKNRIYCCQRRIGEYHENFIESIKREFPSRELYEEEKNKMYDRYPYTEVYEKYTKKILSKYSVPFNQNIYDLCRGISIEAYLYSIHRFMRKSSDHAVQYIKKIIYVYLICKMNIEYDASKKRIELDENKI